MAEFLVRMVTATGARLDEVIEANDEETASAVMLAKYNLNRGHVGWYSKPLFTVESVWEKVK